MITQADLAPLFALDEWTSIVVLLVGGVIWLLNQLFGREKEVPKPPQRRVAQAGGRPAGQSPVDEIDRFLREIASRRQGAEQNAPEMEVLRPPTARRPAAQPRRAARPPQRQAQPLRPLAQAAPPPVAETARRPLVEAHLESQVAEHVREHLTADVAQHVRQHLGTAPGREAEAMPSVATGLGSLPEPAGVVSSARRSDASGLAALLRTGVGLRQAVVLTEIFGPPLSRRSRRR
jgi:hypothetical protein